MTKIGDKIPFIAAVSLNADDLLSKTGEFGRRYKSKQDADCERKRAR